MKLQKTLCLLLSLLSVTPCLHAHVNFCDLWNGGSLTLVVVGMGLGTFHESSAEVCRKESAMIPYDAVDYNQRKEELLKKYRYNQKKSEYGFKISLLGISGLGCSLLLPKLLVTRGIKHIPE